MRKAVLGRLVSLAQQDPAVLVLTADTGFHVFDEFQRRFPDQYLNVGIAEAAMVSMASGLAIAGRRVFLYGIVPFVTLRCLEQIRVDLCGANLPVVILGVGGGLTYGSSGMTHHSIEDVAAMASLPNMTVVCPGDPLEAEALMEASVGVSGPCYFRLGKTGERAVHAARPEVRIGRGIEVRPGARIALVATGGILRCAADACDLLRTRGVRAGLVSMHTVKPIDRDLIADLAGRYETLVTVEEHNVIGGLGAMVAGVIADEDLPVRLRRIAIGDEYARCAGSQDYLRQCYGLSPGQIADVCLALATPRREHRPAGMAAKEATP